MVIRTTVLRTRAPARIRGVTLPEVVITIALLALVVSGTLYAYFHSSRRAEWSLNSLAAHSMAVMGLEETRAAKWDPYAFPPVDLLVGSNFPPRTNLLDIPSGLTNGVLATNFTIISNISSVPPLKFIQVNTVWTFRSAGRARVYTNSIFTYRAPDS